MATAIRKRFEIPEAMYRALPMIALKMATDQSSTKREKAAGVKLGIEIVKHNDAIDSSPQSKHVHHTHEVVRADEDRRAKIAERIAKLG